MELMRVRIKGEVRNVPVERRVFRAGEYKPEPFLQSWEELIWAIGDPIPDVIQVRQRT